MRAHFLSPATTETSEKWVTLEHYLQQKTAVQFSHGLCADCMREIYPDLAEEAIAQATGPIS